MEEYKVGTVFELYEEDQQRYIVLNSLDKDSRIYLLVAPMNDQNGEYKVRYDETFVLCIDKETGEIDYVEDEQIVGEVIDNFFANGKS